MKGQHIEPNEELKCKRCGVENLIYNAQSKKYSLINTEDFQEIFRNIPKGKKNLILGGHYYINNFDNPNKPSKNAQKTFDTACTITRGMKNLGLECYVNVMLNDVELPIEQEKMGLARELVRDNFSFPEVFINTLKKYSLCESDLYNPTLRKISGKPKRNSDRCIAKVYDQGAESEKKYVNRFTSKKESSFFTNFPELSEQFFDTNHGNGNGIPNACSKAVVQYLFDSYNTSIDNSIFIVPGCTKRNLKKSIDLAKLALPNLNITVIYQTPSCYNQLKRGKQNG